MTHAVVAPVLVVLVSAVAAFVVFRLSVYLSDKRDAKAGEALFKEAKK